MIGPAILLSLAAALSWGVAQVVSKLGLARMDLVRYALVRAAFALLFAVPYGIITGAFRFAEPTLIGMAAVAGLIDSFLGTLLYMYALKRGEAHGAAALANTAPFWGVATAVIFLGEPARPTTFFAALLVVAGAYFLISPKRSRERTRSVKSGLAALGAAVLWGVAETGPAKYCVDRGMSPVEFQLTLVITAILSWGLLALLNQPWRGNKIDPTAIGIAFFTAATGFLRLDLVALGAPIGGGEPPHSHSRRGHDDLRFLGQRGPLARAPNTPGVSGSGPRHKRRGFGVPCVLILGSPTQTSRVRASAFRESQRANTGSDMAQTPGRIRSTTSLSSRYWRYRLTALGVSPMARAIREGDEVP